MVASTLDPHAFGVASLAVSVMVHAIGVGGGAVSVGEQEMSVILHVHGVVRDVGGVNLGAPSVIVETASS
jgi:hypothetical protein